MNEFIPTQEQMDEIHRRAEARMPERELSALEQVELYDKYLNEEMDRMERAVKFFVAVLSGEKE